MVVLLTLTAAAFGAYSLKKLPIDAVPDITNNQVQISTMAAGLSPFEMEKQVTFPIESALSGIPGLQQTRSMTRTDSPRSLRSSKMKSASTSLGSK
nr:efflux RND transporter permease subunit [Oscillatoria laete-virens]